MLRPTGPGFPPRASAARARLDWRRLARWTSAACGLVAVLAGAAGAQRSVVTMGEVRSDGKVEVKSKVAVPIRRIAVEEGQSVTQGQLLVEMANDVARAQVEAARADVRRARSAVAESELGVESTARELERNLKVPDLMTARELDQSRDAARRAEGDLATRRDELLKAEAQLAVAQAGHDDTMILAPFDGLVSRIYLRPGATPKVADTTLLDFLTLDRLYVEVPVPLPYLRAISKGMPATVVVEDEHSAIATPTAGRVSYVYPEVDVTTRMFRVKVQVERREFRVLPGMLAKVTMAASPPREGRAR
jgi:RND family efflux transporter MFP subunit